MQIHQWSPGPRQGDAPNPAARIVPGGSEDRFRSARPVFLTQGLSQWQVLTERTT